jgi:UDP-glucose 4-epimerase
VLVTGAAGFVGSHLSERLVDTGYDVVGVDCFTDFYARSIKEANLARLRDEPSFRFLELDLSTDDLGTLLEDVEIVFHLAAQAGVRGSFGESFETYLRNNLRATQRLLEAATTHTVNAFVYASSSSVYGNAASYPTTEHGPRQRPDMAFSRFLRRILDDEPLTLLGDGTQVRDFTYIEDIVEGTIAAAWHGRPGTAYNIGGGRSVQLITAIGMIERLTDRRARIELAPPQLGDAYRTGCDGRLAKRHLGYVARTSLEQGLAAQLEWALSSQRSDVLRDAA